MNTQLSTLMRQATENLEPVTPDLLERTVHQGIRLRRRRTTLVTATGAGAVLATAALITGGLQLVNHNPTPVTPQVAGKPTVAAPHASAKETLATLRSLVSAPGRTLSAPESSGKPADGYLTAAYVVNDGKGGSRIEVGLSGPPAKPGPGTVVSCQNRPHCTMNPDGSALITQTNLPEYPDNRQKTNGIVSNSVTLMLRDGRTIILTNYNGTLEKGTKHTRPLPLFTTTELTKMAHSQTWKFPPAQKQTPKPHK
ncbi:hypothetical protein AB0E69_35170 [Kribbella sp. NPDC026611]|uniref:hypothetical protein n=1 Tax=Kribbella sp. NPDC026611 TaxID=3154911 RepID=UPI003401BDCC